MIIGVFTSDDFAAAEYIREIENAAENEDDQRCIIATFGEEDLPAAYEEVTTTEEIQNVSSECLEIEALETSLKEIGPLQRGVIRKNRSEVQNQ